VIEIMKESEGKVIGIRATGMLITADYDQVIVPKLAELARRFDTIRVLFYMDQGFKGWDLPAAWTNTKLNFKFRDDLDKVAIVGAPTWEELCVKVANLLMKGEMRTFQAKQLEDAWKWLRS
jgi:hypothetical protein